MGKWDGENWEVPPSPYSHSAVDVLLPLRAFRSEQPVEGATETSSSSSCGLSQTPPEPPAAAPASPDGSAPQDLAALPEWLQREGALAAEELAPSDSSLETTGSWGPDACTGAPWCDTRSRPLVFCGDGAASDSDVSLDSEKSYGPHTWSV